MALLGLGRQSARELALDEWADVAKALKIWPAKGHKSFAYICDIKVCVRNFMGKT